MDYLGLRRTMQQRSNILVVDDEPSNVQILAEGLSDDYDITVAKNGLEAFNNAQNFQPDLILLDVGLPDVNGYEVCKLLKNHDATRDIPAFFVTARDDDDDELTGLSI